MTPNKVFHGTVFALRAQPAREHRRWASQMRFVPVLVAVALSACATRAPITAVSVLDKNFQAVRQLSNAELVEFEQRWEARTEADVSLKDVGGEHFKLDIAREGKGNRWLYQTTGYVQILSMKKTPVYQVPDAEAFNKLIGAKQ